MSPDRIALVNWVISAVVAGLAGILIAPLVPLVPGTYTLFIVPALAAAVLGRFYALCPPSSGGLALGVLQSVARLPVEPYSWLPRAGRRADAARRGAAHAGGAGQVAADPGDAA